MVDYLNAIKSSLEESLRDNSREEYIEEGDYNPFYSLDATQVMFAAILLSKRGAEGMQSCGERLDIMVINEPTLGELDAVITNVQTSARSAPSYVVIHDAVKMHYSALVLDKDKDGALVATAFDGLGKGNFDKSGIQKKVKDKLDEDGIQKKVKNKLDEAGVIFKDQSQMVQVGNCCGLTAASFISNYDVSRDVYLNNQAYKAPGPILSGDGDENQRVEAYKSLGVRVFSAIEEDVGADRQPRNELIAESKRRAEEKKQQEVQIKSDETLARRPAAGGSAQSPSTTTNKKRDPASNFNAELANVRSNKEAAYKAKKGAQQAEDPRNKARQEREEAIQKHQAEADARNKSYQGRREEYLSLQAAIDASTAVPESQGTPVLPANQREQDAAFLAAPFEVQQKKIAAFSEEVTRFLTDLQKQQKESQIKNDEAFALGLAAEGTGIDIGNIDAIKESQQKRWQELVSQSKKVGLSAEGNNEPETRVADRNNASKATDAWWSSARLNVMTVVLSLFQMLLAKVWVSRTPSISNEARGGDNNIKLTSNPAAASNWASRTTDGDLGKGAGPQGKG